MFSVKFGSLMMRFPKSLRKVLDGWYNNLNELYKEAS